MSETNEIGIHPYRDSEFVVRCVECAEPALLRCPRCERPHCALHAQVATCCSDCEVALSRRTRRFASPVLAAYGLGALAGAAYIAATSTMAGLLTVGIGALCGVVLSRIIRRLVRRTARRGWTLVERAQLAIAPRDEEAGAGPGPRRLGGRGRERDMYTAARKAGYGLVTPV
jgi:hypothetical protein